MDIRSALKFQYHAALKTLREAIEKCPDAMWNDPAGGAVPFWRVAYHALFFGFPWYKMGTLEHQLVNIRHIQHHAAMLSARLREGAGIGIDWVGRAVGRTGLQWIKAVSLPMCPSQEIGGFAVGRYQPIAPEQHITNSIQIVPDDLALPPSVGLPDQRINVGLFCLLSLLQFLPPSLWLLFLLTPNALLLFPLLARLFRQASLYTHVTGSPHETDDQVIEAVLNATTLGRVAKKCTVQIRGATIQDQQCVSGKLRRPVKVGTYVRCQAQIGPPC
jgi:hypothetical protein